MTQSRPPGEERLRSRDRPRPVRRRRGNLAAAYDLAQARQHEAKIKVKRIVRAEA